MRLIYCRNMARRNHCQLFRPALADVRLARDGGGGSASLADLRVLSCF